MSTRLRLAAIVGVVSVVAGLMITGLGQSAPTRKAAPNARSAGPIRIEGPFFGVTNKFFGVIKKGADAAARQTGVKLIWTVQQTFSVSDAVNSMNTSLARHPDVWLVVDVDPKSMDPIIKKAIAAGITVIDINSRGDVKNPPYLFYIGSDALLEGQMAGNTVWAASNGTLKRAVCANQVLGDVTLELRCKGYRTVLRSHGVKVDEIDVAGGPSQAQAKTQAYFTAHKDSGAIYTLTAGPEAFDPALAALKQLHLNGKVKFVANDLSTPALQAVKAGDVVGLIDQQQYLQGYEGVQWAWLYKTYGMVPGGGQILTGPSLVTKANANQVSGLVARGYR